MIEAYPLHWPLGYPRNPYPERNRHFKQSSLAKVRDLLIVELGRLGAYQIVISTNIPLRQDGLPYADFERRHITDKGVAVYFRYPVNEQYVMCCDQWDRWEDNFYALCKTVEALRGLERWGVSEIMKRTFTGLKALPEVTTSRPWWEVLEIPATASQEQIKAAYLAKAKTCHPDRPTGSHTAFIELQGAYNNALNS